MGRTVWEKLELKQSQIRAMKFKQGQIKSIDSAINEFNKRKQKNINGHSGEYQGNDMKQDPNSNDAKREYVNYNRQIKSLQKERATIKGQMVLLEK